LLEVTNIRSLILFSVPYFFKDCCNQEFYSFNLIIEFTSSLIHFFHRHTKIMS
jgi:hypothetical protein